MTNESISGRLQWTGSLLAVGAPTVPPDSAVPTSAAWLLVGLGLLAGFVLGMTVEYADLRSRERQLARSRRLLAARARGLRRQQMTFYRLHDESGGKPLAQDTPLRPRRPGN